MDTIATGTPERRPATAGLTLHPNANHSSQRAWFDLSSEPRRPATIWRKGGVLCAGLLLIFHTRLASTRTLAQCEPTWVLVSNTGPAARAGHAMAYDTARERVVLYGGSTSAGESDETWEWDGTSWHRMGMGGVNPGPRHNVRMAYDAARARIVLFGDETSDFPQTWLWDGSTWTWIDETPSGNRASQAMAYDPIRQRVVSHGGAVWIVSTHEWDGSTWQFRSQDTPPAGRHSHGAAFFPPRGKVVMFGGYTSPGIFSSELWEWDGSSWSLLPALSPPTGRAYFGIAYDAGRQRLVIVGGGNATQCGSADTLEFDGASWAAMNSGPALPTLSGPSAAYDAARGVVLLFGGSQNACSSISRSTFVWTSRPYVTSNPIDQTTCPAGSTPFAVTLAGPTPSSVQWQVADASVPGGWSNAEDGDVFAAGRRIGVFSGSHSASLVVSDFYGGGGVPIISVPVVLRCIVTNACGSATSNLATLTICVADTDDGSGSGNCDGGVTIDDLLYYNTIYADGVARADIDDGSSTGTPDGGVTIDDLLYYLFRFEEGC